MDDYKKIYQTLLEPFQERLWSHEMTSCPVIVGSNYETSPFRMLYIGRAVNGWEFDWHEDTLEGLANQVFSHGFDVDSISTNPIQPDGYNFNRSPFWQLCYKLLELNGEASEWSSRVAWSNLFKVAPYSRYNPDDKDIVRQIKPCIELIKKEIEMLKPTHVVFVTDTWWMEPADYTDASFAKELGITLVSDSTNTIVGQGTYNGTKMVVTKRPETAKTSRADHAQQIIDTFSSLSL